MDVTVTVLVQRIANVLVYSELRFVPLISSNSNLLKDNYKENRLLEKATGSPVLECHSYCSCRPNICNNRVLQQGITVQLKVAFQ